MRNVMVKANVSMENINVTYGSKVRTASAPRHKRTMMQKCMWVIVNIHSYRIHKDALLFAYFFVLSAILGVLTLYATTCRGGT